MSLTIEQQACNFETMRHIEKVRNYLNSVIRNLLNRAEKHDQSKLESPEVEVFTEYTPQLEHLTFGQADYAECKKKMAPALEHHYARNRHHPEHHKNGVNDMTLLDLIEMLVDCKSSSERQNNGNLFKSMESLGNHFGMSAQLIRIMENTAKELF